MKTKYWIRVSIWVHDYMYIEIISFVRLFFCHNLFLFLFRISLNLPDCYTSYILGSKIVLHFFSLDLLLFIRRKFTGDVVEYISILNSLYINCRYRDVVVVCSCEDFSCIFFLQNIMERKKKHCKLIATLLLIRRIELCFFFCCCWLHLIFNWQKGRQHISILLMCVFFFLWFPYLQSTVM